MFLKQMCRFRASIFLCHPFLPGNGSETKENSRTIVAEISYRYRHLYFA